MCETHPFAEGHRYSEEEGEVAAEVENICAYLNPLKKMKTRKFGLLKCVPPLPVHVSNSNLKRLGFSILVL